MPSISIIIPLYNKERYIKRAILSVLSQTVSDFECIIIDSSTDSSSDIIREFQDCRLIHQKREKTSAAAARNWGVIQSHTNLVAFLDADDEWTSDHLKCLIQLHKQYPEAGLISTPYIKLYTNGSQMVMIFQDIPPPPWHGILPNYLRTSSFGDIPIHSSSCAVRKDVFLKIGGFNENYVYGEDQHLWGRIALNYPIAFCWQGIAIYHTEAEGRICNDPHYLPEDPFSCYLQDLIDQGNIRSDLIPDALRYIKRRKKTILLSNIISWPYANILDNTNKPKQLRNSNNNREFRWKLFSQICNMSITWRYRPLISNYWRKIICFLTKSYYPHIIEKALYTQTNSSDDKSKKLP